MTGAAPTTSREAVIAALRTLLESGGDFKLTRRRLSGKLDTIPATQTPALILLESADRYEGKALGQPPVRRMMVRALVYFDVGADANAIPAATLNPILDRFDALLALDPARGPCTLGGLVAAARIEGSVIKAPGDATGKGLAAVPIEILLP